MAVTAIVIAPDEFSSSPQSSNRRERIDFDTNRPSSDVAEEVRERLRRRIAEDEDEEFRRRLGVRARIEQRNRELATQRRAGPEAPTVIRYSGAAFGIAVVPPLLLYVFGWAVAWIMRGLRG